MMTTLTELLAFANMHGIAIDKWPMNSDLTAFAMPEGWIAVDYSKFNDETELCRVIAHEIGHIMTGSFYRMDAPAEYKAKCEHQADEWAAAHLNGYN